MTWRERIRTAWGIMRGRINVHEHTVSIALPGDDARRLSAAFVQWKGTRVCMDVSCPLCGHDGHIDADFAYFLQCGECGTMIEVGTYVPIFAIAEWHPLHATARDFLSRRPELLIRDDDSIVVQIKGDDNAEHA